jgi:hypothetical protein
MIHHDTSGVRFASDAPGELPYVSRRYKYTDFEAAATSDTVTFDLPIASGAIVPRYAVINLVTAFAASPALATAAIIVGKTGATNEIMATITVAATTGWKQGAAGAIANISKLHTSYAVLVTLTCDINCSTLTAGEVEVRVYFENVGLP